MSTAVPVASSSFRVACACFDHRSTQLAASTSTVHSSSRIARIDGAVTMPRKSAQRPAAAAARRSPLFLTLQPCGEAQRVRRAEHCTLMSGQRGELLVIMLILLPERRNSTLTASMVQRWSPDLPNGSLTMCTTCSTRYLASPPAAMSVNASHGLDGSSPAVPSPSPALTDPNDPTHSLPSFAFILCQLSLLLTSLGSTANDSFAHQQLLGAMSNMLAVSLHCTHPLAPGSPAEAVAPSPSSPAVQAAPAPPVPSPVIEPPRPSTPPPPRSSSPPAPSTPPPAPAPIFAICVLTPIEQLRPPPLRPQHARRSSRKRRRARSCLSSPVSSSSCSTSASAAVHTSILFAPLAQLDDGAAEQASGDDMIASEPSILVATSSSPAALPSPTRLGCPLLRRPPAQPRRPQPRRPQSRPPVQMS